MKHHTWHVYRPEHGPADADDVRAWLDQAPPWRRPHGHQDPPSVEASPFPTDGDATADALAALARARTFVMPPEKGHDIEQALDRVNMALLLRRPLLVRGEPGLGKSSLAYSLAWVLGLGRPLRWEISSRTTLQDGLSRYDAVGHLQATRECQPGEKARSIDHFITLGPLGTALLPWPKPRVLLVDELDKAAYDLPNDLLHAFEEGRFSVDELRGRADAGAQVWTEEGQRVPLAGSAVGVRHHPVVVITSNDERDFPPAFRRRCVELSLGRPDDDQMRALVAGWFRDEQAQTREAIDARLGGLLERFEDQATDVLLQASFLEAVAGADPERIAAVLSRKERK